MNIFEYEDYRKWVLDQISSMGKKGRGQLTAIAHHLSTSTSIVTLVFKGDRDLTPEQAVLLAEFFGLPKHERDYLILLVNYSRAATIRYKEILKEGIRETQVRAQELSFRVAQNAQLSEESKAIIYSNWYYLAIWSLTAISEFRTPEAISQRLGLSRQKTNEALQFLVKEGLVKSNDGLLEVGSTLLHLESTSPNVSRHHQNWRLKAFPKQESPHSKEIFYTAPVTLSEEDTKKMRDKIVAFIADTVKDIQTSPSEKFYCLGIDWFEV